VTGLTPASVVQLRWTHDVKNVAEGTHEKLLNECMTYKELFEKIDSN